MHECPVDWLGRPRTCDGLEACRSFAPTFGARQCRHPQVATNLTDVSNHDAVSRSIKKHGINLVVVGPEAPLVEGLVDHLLDCGKHPELVVVGPRKEGAQLEGSKAFAKAFMRRHNIPTAGYGSFDGTQVDEAIAFLDTMKPPYVLKADGLAAGKGVITGSRKPSASS